MRIRTASDFERLLGNGYALPPYSVSFWLTRQCNLACRMCWVDQSSSGGKSRLTLDEYRAIVDQLVPFMPRVSLTGGEPLLNPIAVPLSQYIKGRGLRLSLNTNGTLLADVADTLVETGLDDISISIDGVEHEHDSIRGKKGAFRDTVEGIEAVVEAKRRRGVRWPIVRINFTIIGPNTQFMKDVFELGKEKGVDCISYQHTQFITPALIERHNQVFQSLFGQTSPNLDGFARATPEVDTEKLYETIVNLKNRVGTGFKPAPTKVNFYPELTKEQLSNYYQDPEAPIRSKCRSRWYRVDIGPEGDVTPCLSYVAGDLRVEPLLKIWNNESYRRFRRELKRAKTYPGCLRCCGLFSD